MSVEVSLSREIKIIFLKMKRRGKQDQSQLSYSSIRYFCRLNVSLNFATQQLHPKQNKNKNKKTRFLRPHPENHCFFNHLIQKTTVSSSTSFRKPLFLQPPHPENYCFFNHLIQKTTVSSTTSSRKPPFL